MNPTNVAKEVQQRVPRPPRTRAPKGSWIAAAWAVRILVEREKWNVSDAVRQVIDSQKLGPEDQAFIGIRAAYYDVRTREWPEHLKQ